MLTFNNPSNIDDASNASLLLNGATGVTTAVVNGTTYVFVAGNVDDGISVFSLNASGVLTNVFNVTDAGALELDGAVRLTTAVVGGTTYLFSTGNADNGVSVFSVSNAGALTNVFNVNDGAGATPPLLTSATGIATALSGGNRYLIVTSIADDAVSVFSVANTGALTQVASVVDDGTLKLDGAAAVTTAIVNNITYVFVAGANDDGVSTFRLNTDGSLTNIAGGNVSDNATLELNGAQTLTTAVVAGTTYLFVGSTPDDGISVFSVAANGNLTNVFNITDDATLKLVGVADLTTAVINGVTYLYAAGAGDSGISVFSVAASGALTNVANIADAGSLELAGTAGVTTVKVGNTTYLIGTGSTDDGVSVLNQSAPNGQIWYTVSGGINDIIDGHLNSDGSSITTAYLNIPATPGTGYQSGGQDQSIGFDLANDLYFVVDSDGLGISAHRASTGALLDRLQIGDFAGSPALQDIVNSLVVDPYDNVIYVGRWGGNQSLSGVVAVTYNFTTGDLQDSQAYNASQTRFTASGAIQDIRAMDIWTDGNGDVAGSDFLYVTDNNNNNHAVGFTDRNQIYRIDLDNPASVVQMTGNGNVAGQFPTNLSRGLIGSLAVDNEDGILYFTTHQFTDGGGSPAQDALWWIDLNAVNGTATQITLPAGVLHYANEWGGLTYDHEKGQLWISDESPANGDAGQHIVQLQMSADGKSVTSVLATYEMVDLLAHTPGSPEVFPQGLSFDSLPIFTKTDVGTAAGEQGARVDVLSTVTITDSDGDHLSSAKAVLSGGFAGSGDLFFVFNGSTEQTSGLFSGTNITITQTTDAGGGITLSLTGYDTLANYQTVLNAIGFRSTGDNPTNYGYNDTRTVSWTVSDGAPNVPFGGQNTGTTTLSITAVDDAPTNNPLPGSPSIPEDAQTAITGIVISDPDADPANQDITVTFSVQHGTLNILTTVLNGVLASDVAGQNTNAVTITAPINSINTTIAGSGLRYTSDLNYNGSETLHIVTSDNGHTGTGGPLGDTDDLSITVTPVNDPVTGTAPASAVVDEDQSVAISGMSIADVDTVIAPNGIYEVTLSATNGTVTLTTLTGLTFTAGDGTADATMTFHGILANINTAIATASYAPALNFNGAATVTLFVTDTFSGTVATGSGLATSDTDVVNVTVNAVNDPVTTNAPATATLDEDSVNFAVAGLSIADVDATLAPAGVYEVTLSATQGVLNLTTIAGLTFTSGDGTNDTTMTFHGTLSSINTALATTKYSPNANYNGSAQITLQATDTFGGIVATGSGLATSDSDTINVTVTAVNDPVTGTAPANLSTTEDSGSVAVTGLLISDVDAALAPAGVYSVTISASHGTLTLSTTTGLTFDTGDGTADATMTFHGTLSDINTAVATATYAPNGNYNGSDTIVFSVTDTFGGIVATGTGLATSDSDNIAVTVSAVNDPVTSNAPATATVNEDVSTAIAGLSISDVDATLAPAGVYEVTLSATNGTLTMTTLTGLTFTAGDGTADATMTFHGTLSDINTALATTSYKGNLNFNGPAQISINVTDTFGGIVATGTGIATSDSDTINVTVNSVNDAPAVTTGGPLVYTENDPASGIMGGGGVVTDADSADFNGGSLTVSFGANARAADQLSIITDSTILLNGTTVQYDSDGAGGNPALDIGTITTNGANGANLVVSFNTTDATAAAVTALIQHVAYANSSDNPVGETRVATFTVNDGDGTANGGVDTGSSTANVTVVAKNDAPVATITPTSYTGVPLVAIDLKNTLSVSDVDDNGASETVTLSVTFGILDVTPGTSGAGVVGSGTTSVQITGTIAQINDLLNTNSTSTVNYSDTTGGTRTLTLAINDNGNSGTPPPGAQSAQDTATINLGEPPVVDLNGGGAGFNTTASYTENDPATAIAPAGVTTDLDSPNYNGGSLTVHFSANGAAEDQLSILTDGTVTVASGTVSIGGLAIGTVAGGTNGSDLVISFNTTDATQAAVSTLIEHIAYANNSDNPSTAARTASFTINDGTGATGSADATIAITATNDGPAATITPTSYSATEQTALILKNTGLSVSDIDANAGNETVTLSVTEGVLNVTPGTSGAVVNNSGTASVTITGTIAQINDLLNTNATSTVSYIDNTDDPSASATLTLLIHDNGNTGTGGDKSSSDSATINIASVNDAPGLTNVPASAAYTENAAATKLAPSILITDPDPFPHGAPGGNGLILVATAKIASGFVTGDRLLVDDTSDAAPPATQGFYTGINVQWNYDATTHILSLFSADPPTNSGDTIIDFDHVLQNVYFDSTSDDPTNGGANLTRTIEWQVQDAGGTANGGTDLSSVYTTTINVSAINDPPVAAITPTSYTATEQTALNLKNNGLSVTDVDGSGGSETVTLSVGVGVLNVTAGGSGAIVNNSGTASVTITGTAAQINALLNTDGTSSVSYLNGSDTPPASTSLTLLVHDNGNTGAGGDQSSSDSATINITAVNDAPVLTGLTDTPAFIENGPSVRLDANSNAAVSDPELNISPNKYQGATLTIQRQGGPNSDDSFSGSGTLDLSDVNGLGENVSLDGGATFIGTFVDNGDGAISFTFNANATAANIGDVMRQIFYGNASDNPPTTVPIDFIFNDGNSLPGGQPQGTGAGVTTATVNVQVTQVNDRPVLLNVDPGAAYTIGSAGVTVSPNLAVFDSDAAPPSTNVGIKNAVVAISDGYLSGDQLFVKLPTSGGFFIVDDGSGPIVTNISVQSSSFGRLVLTGTDTTLHYQLVLDAVNYRSTAADPSDHGLYNTRTITWQVNDGAPLTGPLLLTPATTYSAGGSTFHVANADLNGDGALDLITANFSGTVSVLLGSGIGTFGAATNFAAGAGANEVAIGDLNGDGKLDLAVADFGGGVSVLLGDGAGGFGAPTLFPAGTQSAGVGIADFNSDGIADLAVANQASANVSVLLGTGGGSFGAATNFAAGPTLTDLVVGDFNNDGKADIAVSSGTSAQVFVLINNGSGSFASTGIGTGAAPQAIATADLNGDGNLDLVTANFGGTVSVLLGAGNGTFGGATPFATLAGTSEVKIGDFNADGKLDIATVNETTSTVSVLLGNGNGTFAPHQDFSLPAGQFFGLTLGDFNRDGGLDAVAADSSNNLVAVLLNSGTNSSAPASTQLHFDVPPAVDLDASGAGTGFTTTYTENGAAIPFVDTDLSITDPDNATLEQATIVLTNAKAGDVLSVAGALPGGISSAIDTSVAGKITLRLTNSAVIADYVTAIGQLRFASTGENPDTTDRDITVEVGVAEASSNTAHALVHVVAVNDAPVNTVPGAQTATQNVNLPIAGIAISDVDAVSGVLTTTLSVLHGTLTVSSAGGAGVAGSGTASVTLTGTVAQINTTLSASNNVVYKAVPGFTGADTLSVVTNDGGNTGTGGAQSDTDTVAITVGQGHLHWDHSVDVGPHPAGWLPAGLGDFNGNGTTDLGWFNSSTGNFEIWTLSNGNWAGSTSVGSHPAGYQPVSFGDFNGDHTSDVLWYNPTTRDVDLWKISNGAWAGSVSIGSHPAGSNLALTGDFNGDGTADILWYNPTTTAVDIWKISNTGQWAGSVDVGTHPAGFTPALAGDFNGDGTSDVLWYNASTGQVDIWKLSNGQWAGSTSVGSHPLGWQPLGAADFNLDGTTDIAWHNPTTNNIDVWLIKNGQWAESVNIGSHPAAAGSGGSVTPLPPQPVTAVGVGDFDHSGVNDIMWYDQGSRHIDNWMLAFN